MRNNRKTSGRRKSKNATFAIPVQFANTKPANAFDARIRKISSKKYKQGTTISSTQKSETEQTQTIGEMKSKTLDPTKLSFKTDKLFSKTPTKHVLGTLGKRKSSNFADEKFDKQKLKDKIEIVAIEHQIPPIRIDTTQDLPDFAQEEPEFKKPEGLESIAPSLLKRKVKSAEPSKSLKTEKIDSKKTDRIDRKDSG
ncbi:unnamed protein product [Onchocerca ochengi]|uniref:Nucleolar protein 56 n=1 Tax=Onchocerca ochengi TaxID=42157 RepID=A0A182EIT4_ONCOC|nr:unnamed protein product [Onchocerca ochengi]